MKVILVDNDERDLSRLQQACLRSLRGAKFFAYLDPTAAIEESAPYDMDIAFLDINMPQLDGIELARRLKERDPFIQIIFVTSHEERALDAYSVRAAGFILKPINETKIQDEIAELRKLASKKSSKKIQVKCFGNFEIFYDGVPLQFKRSKSKEMLAYLIDHEGVPVGVDELCSILWEESRPSYFRNLVSDIRQTLESVGCEDFFLKQRNAYAIDVNKVDCDAYEFKNGNPDAIAAFRGQYMFQYSWAMFIDD